MTDEWADENPWPTGSAPRGVSVTASNNEVRVTSPTGGQKASKLARYDLIPAMPLKALAEHFGRGVEKYEDISGVQNWRLGYDYSLAFAAMQRHAWQWWAGEDTDAETGSSHLTAVAWHAFVLLQFLQDHPDYDNRPTSEDLL